MSSVAAEEKAATAAGLPAPQDVALLAVVALVHRVRRDAQAGGGGVDVPATIAALRSEAASAGFGGDAASLWAYLQSEASAGARQEQARREAGLGGLMRRAAEAAPWVRGRAAVVEAAAQRPFVDPGLEAGDGSLLTSRVREATARLEAASRAAMGH